MTVDRRIPAEWRESVRRDLEEEAARAGLRGSRRKLWIAWQILRVAARFRWRDRGLLPSKNLGRTLMSGLATDLRLALRFGQATNAGDLLRYLSLDGCAFGCPALRNRCACA